MLYYLLLLVGGIVAFLVLLRVSKSDYKGYGYRNWARGHKDVPKEELRKRYARYARIIILVIMACWIIGLTLVFYA